MKECTHNHNAPPHLYIGPARQRVADNICLDCWREYLMEKLLLSWDEMSDENIETTIQKVAEDIVAAIQRRG